MAIPTLRIGSHGPAVVALQRALNAAAPFVRLSEDGDYGHHTYLEVSHYQRAAGLTIDGVAGPLTLGALGLTPAPPSDPAPQTQPTGAYLTPLDDIAPPVWQRIGDALLTREPLRSASTGLYARLTYHGALDACSALGGGASLATPDDVQALHDAAAAGRGAVEVAPVTLPTVAMVRGAGYAGSVNSAEFQAAAQALRVASMRSIEWCRAHDALVAERLAAAGWDGVAAVAGAGKHWVAGAPPGRAYLMGWWTPHGWIQPRPAPGSQGPHDRGHSDYSMTTIARRPLAASDGAEDNEGPPVIHSLPSPHFSPGRPFGPPRLLVLHTTENDCAPGVAAAVARYFAAPSTQASAHYVVGPDACYQCVADGDRAWHVGAAGNPRSLGIEQTGRARFSEAEWASPAAEAMLSRVVALLAWLCRRWGIPAVVVEGSALASRNAAGITTHAAVAAALGGTDHYDPGPAYPLDRVVARVAAVVAEEP